MAQTVLSAVLEVQGPRAPFLRERIGALRQAQSGGARPALCAQVGQLHCLSMTVFTDAHYDPVWVIEANFDGPAGPFWAALEAAIGEELRVMLRACKPPRDGTRAMFDAIIAPGSRRPVAPYLEARSQRPAVAHQGNRGLDRPRIDREAALFSAAQDLLEDRAAYQDLTARQIHSRLRDQLLGDHPWLQERPPPRIGDAEDRADHRRWRGFVVLVLAGLLAPTILAWLVLPWCWVIGLSLVLSLVFLWCLRDDLASLKGRGPPGPAGTRTLVLGVLALLVAAAGVAPVLLGLVAWLRWLERRDPPQEDPVLDAAAMREMAEREDRHLVNHMGSIVQIKPGILRAVVVRAGLTGLGLYLRTMPRARAGYLASMRTIHFAHWAIIGNGGRLMFFSNFDGTWESYLDDFIEKAHGGLTLAWCNGVGFPPTRFLVGEGATNGRLFKAWARHSMAAADLWVCAYPNLTVDQIERQAAIADGLRSPALTEKEASAWAMLL